MQALDGCKWALPSVQQPRQVSLPRVRRPSASPVSPAAVWPLFSVCGAALVFCGYASYRHLAKNPEVGAALWGLRPGLGPRT